MPNLNYQLVSAYLLMAISILLVLTIKVVPAILAGLLAYNLTAQLIEHAHIRLNSSILKSKTIGWLIGIGSFCGFSLLLLGLNRLLSGENLQDLLHTLILTLHQSKQYFPATISDLFPENAQEFKDIAMKYLAEHITSVADFGKSTLGLMLQLIIGWLIGILIACGLKPKHTELSKNWYGLWHKLSKAFKFVVYAQLKVAAFNTGIVTIFLFVIAPLFSWEIPYSKTLILVTFVCGLIPILGNLISNTTTFLLAFTVSIPAAASALFLLMAIHKLEYFIISKSLGADINSSIWTLLIVLFMGEYLFGFGGLLFAPILYAFIKSELIRVKWLSA